MRETYFAVRRRIIKCWLFNHLSHTRVSSYIRQEKMECISKATFGFVPLFSLSRERSTFFVGFPRKKQMHNRSFSLRFSSYQTPDVTVTNSIEFVAYLQSIQSKKFYFSSSSFLCFCLCCSVEVLVHHWTKGE